MTRYRIIQFFSLILLLSFTVCAHGNSATSPHDDLLAKMNQRAKTLEQPHLNVAALGQTLQKKQKIIEFVSKEIQLEAYNGLQRGALGTLISRAGNEADKAVLLAELLIAAGHDCHLARGKLNGPDGTTETYVWVRLEQGDDLFVDKIPEAQLRPIQKWKPGTPAPKALQSIIRFSLKSKIKRADGIHTVESLALELNTATLYAQQITLVNRLDLTKENGQSILQEVIPVLAVGEQEITAPPLFGSNTMAPGSKLTKPSSGMAGIFEKASQKPPAKKKTLAMASGKIEVLSQWIQGMCKVPGHPPLRFHYTIIPLQEQTRRPVEQIRALSQVTAFIFSPALITKNVHDTMISSALNDARPFLQFKEIQTRDIWAPDELTAMGMAFESFRRSLAGMVALSFAHRSDAVLRQTETFGASIYHDVPRAIIASVSMVPESGDMRLDLDLAINTIGGSPPAETDENWLKSYRFFRGIYEAELEGAVLADFYGKKGTTIHTVFKAAMEQSIPITLLTQKTRKALKKSPLDAKSKQLINKALGKKQWVILPREPVKVNDTSMVCWYQYHPDTGHIESVFDTGKHQSMIEYTTELTQGVEPVISECMGHFLSMEVGFIFGGISAWSHFIDCALAPPDGGCYGQPMVCDAALEDAKLLCKIWGDCGATVNDILAISKGTWYLVIWPDYVRGELFPACDFGAMLGLQLMGCDPNRR